MVNVRLLVSIVALLFVFQLVTMAENWPGWRGPSGDGTSSEINLPVKWDSTTNVMWKVPVPGVGYASPIVWEDKLFTITALTEAQEKQLLCYDTKTGNWQQQQIQYGCEGGFKSVNFRFFQKTSQWRNC